MEFCALVALGWIVLIVIALFPHSDEADVTPPPWIMDDLSDD